MKKKWRQRICLAMAIFIFFHLGIEVYADQISDLKKKNQEDQQKLDEIDDALVDLTGEQEGIQDEMDMLNAEIVDMMMSISMLEDEIEEKQKEIEQARKDLEVAIADEENQYQAMKVRIQYIYKSGESSFLDIFTQSGSMEDMLNRADYIEKLYDYDRKMLAQFQETKEKIAQLKEELEIEESELEAAKAECEEEKAGMDEAMAELKAINADYEKQIQNAKKQAEAYKEQIKKQNAEIKRLEEEERKRKEAEEAAKRQNSNSGTKVTGTATVNKEEILACKGSDLGKQIAIYGCGFVGYPYVLGGTSLTNGIDCSGFTQALYKAYGYSIPRTSYQQRTVGKEVSYAEAQPGDIICYAGHVALYIGNGKIVHASSPKTGIKISYATYKQIITVRRII